MIDCTNYIECPKGITTDINNIDSSNLNFMFLGCWGVYQWPTFSKSWDKRATRA